MPQKLKVGDIVLKHDGWVEDEEIIVVVGEHYVHLITDDPDRRSLQLQRPLIDELVKIVNEMSNGPRKVYIDLADIEVVRDAAIDQGYKEPFTMPRAVMHAKPITQPEYEACGRDGFNRGVDWAISQLKLKARQ